MEENRVVPSIQLRIIIITMYTALTYAPALTGLLVMSYLIFSQREGDFHLLGWVMFEFGIGLASSVFRVEKFISDVDGVANIPVKMFATGVRGCWVPTLLSFIACCCFIAVVRFKTRNLASTT